MRILHVVVKHTFAAPWDSAHHNMPPANDIASHTIMIIYLQVGNTREEGETEMVVV